VNAENPVLVVTPGEPAGIGPEILVKLACRHPELSIVAVADPGCLQRAVQRTGERLEIKEWAPRMSARPGILHCVPVNLDVQERPGKADPRNAGYVLETLRQAVNLLNNDQADALVTGPVNKATINDGGFSFSGHTEFLADLAGVDQVVMMLAAPGIRVALVTTHLPLREVPDAISDKKLERVLQITLADLQRKFGLDHPRLQVLGLNPHAGEGGHLGSEDDAIIGPVLERFRQKGFDIVGPVPADTAFNPPRLADCDAVVAMYHDQGLPVLKHMGFGQAINITLGLPFIRTSVDHGTALDIAGTGKADESSLYQAILTADEMVRKQRIDQPNDSG